MNNGYYSQQQPQQYPQQQMYQQPAPQPMYQQPQQQMSMQQPPQYAPPAQPQMRGPNDIIVRADASKRILDFRNALVPANPADYAMLHGAGGAKHAARSGIKVVICDYSGGTGNGKSISVAANASPDLFPVLADVALSNMGQYGISPRDGIWSKLFGRFREQGAVFGAFYALVQKLENTFGSTANGRIAPMAPPYYGELAGSFGQARVSMEACAAQNPQAAELSPVPFTRDFQHTQTRVNTRARSRDGFVPVSLLTITRQGYVKGEKRRLPWTVKITNFEARPSGQGNGTAAYDAGSMRNKQECFIQIPDDDMFRCCRRVTRFVEVWEIATGVSLVSNGLATREQAREDYRRQKNENRC